MSTERPKKVGRDAAKTRPRGKSRSIKHGRIGSGPRLRRWRGSAASSRAGPCHHGMRLAGFDLHVLPAVRHGCRRAQCPANDTPADDLMTHRTQGAQRRQAIGGQKAAGDTGGTIGPRHAAGIGGALVLAPCVVACGAQRGFRWSCRRHFCGLRRLCGLRSRFRRLPRRCAFQALPAGTLQRQPVQGHMVHNKTIQNKGIQDKAIQDLGSRRATRRRPVRGCPVHCRPVHCRSVHCRPAHPVHAVRTLHIHGRFLTVHKAARQRPDTSVRPCHPNQPRVRTVQGRKLTRQRYRALDRGIDPKAGCSPMEDTALRLSRCRRAAAVR